MPLPIPKLDLRSFDQLMETAKKTIGIYDNWTDHTPNDPGMILLEAFSHLTEVLIYRVNRMPERAQIELLNLLGICLLPPSSASTVLRFQVDKPTVTSIHIPRGFRVSAKGDKSGPVVFSTVEEATIEPPNLTVDVVAYHCQIVTEVLGQGTGRGGQRFTTSGGPFAQTEKGSGLDVVVGVELSPDEQIPARDCIEYENKKYRRWQSVESFSPSSVGPYPYMIDRATGTVRFAPALQSANGHNGLSNLPQAIAEVPANQREIRIWGPCGGGSIGNVPNHTVVQLFDEVEGVGLKVTNIRPGSGGRDPETLENALLRGPMTFKTIERAISASDYEWLAVQASSGVLRAKAFTQQDLWCFAKPGTVEVVLVPQEGKGAKASGPAGIDPTLEEVRRDLELRKALGTRCEVTWARYKDVAVKAKVVVHGEEDPDTIREQLVDRLNKTINPRSKRPLSPTWQFGTELQVSTVYDIILADPNVHRMEELRLCVEGAPDKDIEFLQRDPHQPKTWYAGGPILYRSLNDGNSWEPVLHAEKGHEFTCIRSHPLIKGLLAATTKYEATLPDGIIELRSRVFISWDCGESWQDLNEIIEVHDLAWLPLESHPILLIASRDGLFRGMIEKDREIRDLTVPVRIETSSYPDDQTVYAVSSFISPRGNIHVAVAMSRNRGVYLSEYKQNGLESFRHIGPGEPLNIRLLEVRQGTKECWLWAGTGVSGNKGQGCLRRDFRTEVRSADGWQRFVDGWEGGACYAIAFVGERVLAATGDRGVLHLELNSQSKEWKVDKEFKSGLPLKSSGELYHPVSALAARSDPQPLVMAAGHCGVYRSLDDKLGFSSCCETEFRDAVSLPATWLIRSGKHEIQVEKDYEKA